MASQSTGSSAHLPGLAASGLATVDAQASTASGTFQVTATVISACTASGALLNIGSSINPLSVQCTNTTPCAVSLNAGSNAVGASHFAARR